MASFVCFDDSASTVSYESILAHILLLIDNTKLLAARQEYDKLLSLLERENEFNEREREEKNSDSDSDSDRMRTESKDMIEQREKEDNERRQKQVEEKERILKRFNEPELSQKLQSLIDRSDELRQVIEDCSEALDDWTLGSDLFGIQTYYRVESDGLLSLRMEGVQDIPIFEQLGVLYEVALFNQWIPFCNQSELLAQLCKLSLLLTSSPCSLLFSLLLFCSLFSLFSSSVSSC